MASKTQRDYLQVVPVQPERDGSLPSGRVKVTMKLPLGKVSEYLVVRVDGTDEVERIAYTDELREFMGKDHIVYAIRTIHSDDSVTYERVFR